ncbi:pyridoxamine 5'-phosphate oxidase family protein [uncultured Sphingomonas sp.]|uniref:pyridoxamine 5'-phosphate oxidase family protein n=1 Tax=uncultured Sphingomonas sp. TaxID=158754 RepID=UPI0025D68383|nr:pyridoxamine 5'-phosphate oxidase family protein [uncultured Sphingomonas sp.]
MAEFFPALTDAHVDFIARQSMFFVATAAEGARVSISPKGYDAFRVINASTVAYLDLGGSGNETQAHLAADGRITIMFCAFDNPALILRLYGRGVAVLPQDDGFSDLAERFPKLPGVRQVFVVHIESVQTSCGWGVPRMTLDAERQTLVKFHAQQDPIARMEVNRSRDRSIDGLPVRVQAFIPAAD